jgi:WD40 repeat protein
VYYVAISPDSTLVASTTYADKTIRLWDADEAVEIARFESPGRGWWVYTAPMVQFSADGTRLASGNDRGGARSVDLATGVSVSVDPTPIGMTSMTSMSWMDAIVAARGQAGGTRISRFSVYSPDGGLFATGSSIAPVPFRAYRGGLDGEIVYELDQRVEAVAISPDGGLLATTGKDGVVHLYDAATGSPRGQLVGHVGPAWAVAFHPHQPLIATGGEDSIIRLWDTARCEQLLELRGHEQYVMDLQFSPDGTMLVSGSGDFTVRLWDTLPRAERETGRARRGRCASECGAPWNSCSATSTTRRAWRSASAPTRRSPPPRSAQHSASCWSRAGRAPDSGQVGLSSRHGPAQPGAPDPRHP